MKASIKNDIFTQACFLICLIKQNNSEFKVKLWRTYDNIKHIGLKINFYMCIFLNTFVTYIASDTSIDSIN